MEKKKTVPQTQPTIQFDWINAFTQQFRKNVEEPIAIRQALLKKSEQQRCLAHNIIYSIYCTVCRKVLCASCMYNSTLHRKHRVIPLDNAKEEIRADIKLYESKVPRIIQHLQGLSQSNTAYLVQVEKEFTPIIAQLQQFYEDLRNFIKCKQKEQRQYLKQLKDELRMEVTAYSKELTRIQQFITDKCQSYANPNTTNELAKIASRSILQNIMLSPAYIKQPQFEMKKPKFNADPQKIRKVFEDITCQINLFMRTPIIPANFSKKQPSSTKSADSRSKASYFGAESKPIQSRGDKKRTNSSVAGVRTVRR